jgi:hypothetical protein
MKISEKISLCWTILTTTKKDIRMVNKNPSEMVFLHTFISFYSMLRATALFRH